MRCFVRIYVVFWEFLGGFDGLSCGTVPWKWLCYACLSEVWSVIFGGFGWIFDDALAWTFVGRFGAKVV